jgi:hypothetical protein
MIRGPKAVARRYIDSAITDSALLMSSSRAIVLIAGAMIVETMMRLKPVAERTSVTVHFFVVGQSLGLEQDAGCQMDCYYGRTGGSDLLVDIERLFEADQIRIVSSIVRLVMSSRQFNANEGFGINGVCHRFTARLMCDWLWG